MWRGKDRCVSPQGLKKSLAYGHNETHLCAGRRAFYLCKLLCHCRLTAGMMGGGKILAINPLFLNSGALGMVAPDSSDMAAFVSPRKAGRLNLRLDKDGGFTQPCRVSSPQNKCIFYSYPKFLFNFFLPTYQKSRQKIRKPPTIHQLKP